MKEEHNQDFDTQHLDSQPSREQKITDIKNKYGSETLQKMGVLKGFADKAVTKGTFQDRLGLNKLIQKKTTEHVANSQLGQKLTGESDENNAGEENKNQGISNPLKALSAKEDGKGKGTINDLKRAKKIVPLIISVFGFLLIIIVPVMIIFISFSGFFRIKEFFSESKTKLGNFLSGCGWSTEEECLERQENDFYDTINRYYVEYKDNYSVELNTNLIVATLTYFDPFLTAKPDGEDMEDFGSTTTDYKKSKRQVGLLVENMVKETGRKCYLREKIKNVYELTPCSTELEYNKNFDMQEKYEFVKNIDYVLDEEGYRKYLEEYFVIKYYLNNEKTEKNKEKALKITEDIYSMVAFYDFMTSKNDSSSNISVNNTMVSIMDSTGNITLEQVTLTDYLYGVVYMNSDNDSQDYLKVVAMAAKNYLYSINNASIDNMPQTLRVRNCNANQLYCSPKDGCHYMGGNTTLASGKDDKGNYVKGPITDTSYAEKIKTAVSETLSDFIIENNTIVPTDLSKINKNQVIQQLKNNSYKEVLTSIYGGSLEQVNLYATGYPLDIVNNNVTSAFGWRIHPISKDCKHHNGTDIAAPFDANIYSIADGIVIVNTSHPSYGYYTIIGHGKYNENTKTFEYYSLYAHQIRLSSLIMVGDEVSAGQKIGNVGSTGNSTGSHLHIEIFTIANGKWNRTDPTDYFKNVELTGFVGGTLYNSLKACESAK